MISLRLGRLDVRLIVGPPIEVMLSGRIDEGSQLGDLVAKIPQGEVAIDTGGVTFVNSIGMREWMRFVRALHWRGDTVKLVRVAEILFAQMNLIPEFKQAVKIQSFHAPYECPACGHESTPLVDAIVHADALRELKAPPVPCPECGGAMQLGDFPERYLSIFKG